MAAEHQPRLLSVEEYFELEKNEAGVCYEYVDGYVYMMAGGSFNHDTIKSNIQGIFRQREMACERSLETVQIDPLLIYSWA